MHASLASINERSVQQRTKTSNPVSRNWQATLLYVANTCGLVFSDLSLKTKTPATSSLAYRLGYRTLYKFVTSPPRTAMEPLTWETWLEMGEAAKYRKQYDIKGDCHFSDIVETVSIARSNMGRLPESVEELMMFSDGRLEQQPEKRYAPMQFTQTSKFAPSIRSEQNNYPIHNNNPITLKQDTTVVDKRRYVRLVQQFKLLLRTYKQSKAKYSVEKRKHLKAIKALTLLVRKQRSDIEMLNVREKQNTIAFSMVSVTLFALFAFWTGAICAVLLPGILS